MLRVESIDVSIKSVRILRGVGLQVGPGQLVGLIGRNGAGKTTLMRAIMGILEPTAGTITFDGAPMEGVPTYRRARSGMGYMPEDRRIIPQLSIEENVSLPAWAAGQAHPDERLRRIYEMIPEVAVEGPQGTAAVRRAAEAGRARPCPHEGHEAAPPG